MLEYIFAALFAGHLTAVKIPASFCAGATIEFVDSFPEHPTYDGLYTDGIHRVQIRKGAPWTVIIHECTHAFQEITLNNDIADVFGTGDKNNLFVKPGIYSGLSLKREDLAYGMQYFFANGCPATLAKYRIKYQKCKEMQRLYRTYFM